jgi:hypothetical protein
MNIIGLEITPEFLVIVGLGVWAVLEFITLLTLFILIPESFTLLYNKAKKGIVAIYDRDDGVRELLTPQIDKETGLIDLEGKYIEITPDAIVPLKCGVRSIWVNPKLNRGITGYNINAPYRYNPASTDVKIEQKAEARAMEKSMSHPLSMFNAIAPWAIILIIVGSFMYVIIQTAGNYSFCKGITISDTPNNIIAVSTTLVQSPPPTVQEQPQPSSPIVDVSPRKPQAEVTTLVVTTTLLATTTLKPTSTSSSSSTTTSTRMLRGSTIIY